ncbi:acyl carrier protein [Haliangium sp.]|uniref:acyl carrier protein n=1 Tax=Haliangium sp. TaxID=2663208 RepID=UPI003D0FEDAF
MHSNDDDLVPADAVARMRTLLESVPALREKVADLALDDSLRAHGLDSLGLIQLLDAIEEHLGCELSDDDLADDNFATLRSLTRTFGGRATRT